MVQSMSASTIWDQVLGRIEAKVGRHSFHTWFKPTSCCRTTGHAWSVRVPNLLFTEWLPKHYSVVLAEALKDVGRPDAELIFVPEGAPSRPSRRSRSMPGARLSSTSRCDVAHRRRTTAGLNPRYTFDTFIVGPSNQFAHAACRAVAEAPSRSYNPLFIYGGVGLGKTHLMHAIGQYVLQHSRGLKLTYISSERFMNEMINAVRYDRILDFRERYRTRRRAAGRRHPVRLGQGRHAERVLPHLQRAARRAEANRDQQRSPAARDSRARGASALALRVGAHRRHPAAGHRDQGRDSQEEGRSRGGAAARQRRACTSPAASSRTSASSRDR